MFCGTDNTPQKKIHIQPKHGEYSRIFHGILSVPHNIVMDPNNVVWVVLHNKLLSHELQREEKNCG
jgi:hypothetical protein